MKYKKNSRLKRQRKSQTVEVSLVSMPFKDLRHPPIQLGLLQRCLERAGISARSHSLELSFVDHLKRGLESSDKPVCIVDEYSQIANTTSLCNLGDWIFRVPPFVESPIDDEAYLRIARERGITDESISIAHKMRASVPGFLEVAAAEILSCTPRIVGFSTVFQQNIASLLLAKVLKTRDPSLTILFGGGNCDGPMGAALHESFDWVDVVVRGEGEYAIVEITKDVLAGRQIRPRPGLCYRVNGKSIAVERARGPQVPMKDVPSPNYDDYFERLARSPLAGELLPEVAILFESSRGCWWGEKSHCTFCGLNSELMTFRSKPAPLVVRELVDLAARHKILDFIAVDDIIDLQHIKELLPLLAAAGHDFTLFYETKSNLSKEQLRAFKLSGVDAIQPGVESLSTPILRLMRKGVSGLHNVRLLKWCMELDITPSWNLLYGFPNEPESEYERMAALIPSLVHLDPPNFTPIQIQRFSPYFERAEEFGLILVGPEPYYAYLYDIPKATLWNLAYDFEHAYSDGRNLEYTQSTWAAVKRWRELGPAARRGLSYRRGPGFLTVSDRRPGFESADYRFEGPEAAIYLGCDAGASVAMLHGSLAGLGFTEFDEEEIEGYLSELVALNLVLREGNTFLSLAVAEKASRAQESDASAVAIAAPQLQQAAIRP